VKLEIAPDAVLDEDMNELRTALRRCGVPSLYPSDRAKPTITTLQRVTRDSVAADLSGQPLELFVADRVIVSRITGIARYQIVHTAAIPASG